MSRQRPLKIAAGSLHAVRGYPPADIAVKRSFQLLITEGQTRKCVEELQTIHHGRMLSPGVWVLSDPYGDEALDELDDVLPREAFCRQCKQHLFCEFVADLAEVLETARLTVACLPNRNSHHIVEVGFGVDGRMRIGRPPTTPQQSSPRAHERAAQEAAAARVQSVRAQSGNEDAHTYWTRYWASWHLHELVEAAGVLGLSWPTTPEKVKEAHRPLVSRYHPDNSATGNEEMMKRVNAARADLLKAMGAAP